MTHVSEARLSRSASTGGLPARRAVARWAWRMFRREWRQQGLVLSLLVVVLAATVVGLGLAANASASSDARFGSADYLVIIPGSDPSLGADVAKLTGRFGTAEVIHHLSIPVPGSVTPIDVRDQDPSGPLMSATLRLVGGRYPSGADEIAVTDGVAGTFGLAVGGQWSVDGHSWRVVGIVENPLDLLEDLAVVAPGTIASPQTVSVLGVAPSGGDLYGLGIDGAQVSLKTAHQNVQAAVVVLVLAVIGSIFVGLVAVAGFSVIAQRRLRGVGLLGALGATTRNLRLALLVNGALVGAAGAVIGAAVGVGAWFVAVPAIERVVNHRIDPLNQSWLAIAGAMILAVVTSVLGSWWPARSASRTPIVSALATRPAPPRAPHLRALPGAIVAMGGLATVAFVPSNRPVFLALGIGATVVGMLLIAPGTTSLLAAAGARAPVAVRLAVRDLDRYRARSGGAVAAVSLAVGIAVAISGVAGAAQVAANSTVGGGNLPGNEIVLWLGSNGAGGPIPAVGAESLLAAQSAVDDIARSVGARSTLALDAAVDTKGNGGTHVGDGATAGTPTYDPVELGIPRAVSEGGHTGTAFYGNESVHVYLLTPEVLAHYGISQSSIPANTDLVTSHANLDAYEMIPIRASDWVPVVQRSDLPTYSSDPTTLITPKAMGDLGLTAVPTGWLLDFDGNVTAAQKAKARVLALQAGLSVETRPTQADLAPLRLAVTAGGIALALAVLAMTVGLIRSETAPDLSTLAATGASSGVRRTITAATAGSLGLLGGLLGTAGAYITLVAWYRRDLSVLNPAPISAILALVVGLPVVAWAVGWLLGGKEPRSLARRRLE
ncbi:FtsX-like permease family protein [Demequina lutea]|uniref:Putative ABC transport system permease protein n=1 Tax=Demequina lutea TaxID=431489 RepID=A0A7Z0CHX3_9MICO|nr:FtsX-like permease family protein [Demequina lutea]NYI41941.1 putative ABC transport system permease protein [Demequina lutea]